MEEHSQSETTISSQFKKKNKEAELASKSKSKLGSARKETTNEEYVNSGIQEGDNVETEKQEQKQKEKVPMEEDQKNETKALEEYGDGESEMEEEEEEDIEEDEEEEGGLEEAKVEESEEKAIEQEKNKEQVARNSEKQSKKSRQKKPTNLEDKPGPLSKKKASKKAASMGMIFMCSSKTKKDCFHYRVFGLPAGKKDMVQKVYKGMRLFLFDVDLKLMYGIYKAATPGGYNIEPKAFKSAFPSQVRFSVLEDCLPLPEEKFKTIIKDNYFTRSKFDCQLTSEQVKKLCKLFVSAGKVSKSKNPGRTRDKPKQLIRGEKRRARFGVDYPLRGHQDQVMYEREVFSPKTAPSRHLPPPLPPPAPLHASHARPREMEAYGRDGVIEHRRRPLHLGSRHLDEVEEHRPRFLDLGPRHLDEVDEHRGRLLDLGPRHPDEVVEIRRRLLDFGPRHRDEFRSYDPYVSYRDRPPPPYLDDPIYSARGPEYSSHPRVGLLSEDRYPEGSSSEYAPRRSLYR